MCRPVSNQLPLAFSQKGMRIEQYVKQQELGEERKKTPPPNTTKTKRVSFYPKVVMKKVLHMNNYTDEEIANTWYTASEMNKMTVEIEVTVYRFLMMKSFRGRKSLRKLDNEKFCSRGLESVMSKSAALQKQVIRDNAYDAVLFEQKKQSKIKLPCDDGLERIARVYKQCTMKSIQGARQLALQDQRDVKQAAQ